MHPNMSIHGPGCRPAQLWKRAQLGALIGRSDSDPQHRAAYAGTSPYRESLAFQGCQPLRGQSVNPRVGPFNTTNLFATGTLSSRFRADGSHCHATTPPHRESVSRTSQAPKQRVNTANSTGAENPDPFLPSLRFVVRPNRKVDAAEPWLPLQTGSQFSNPRETLRYS